MPGAGTTPPASQTPPLLPPFRAAPGPASCSRHPRSNGPEWGRPPPPPPPPVQGAAEGVRQGADPGVPRCSPGRGDSGRAGSPAPLAPLHGIAAAVPQQPLLRGDLDPPALRADRSPLPEQRVSECACAVRACPGRGWCSEGGGAALPRGSEGARRGLPPLAWSQPLRSICPTLSSQTRQAPALLPSPT